VRVFLFSKSSKTSSTFYAFEIRPDTRANARAVCYAKRNAMAIMPQRRRACGENVPVLPAKMTSFLKTARE
jgi:hypothetical protein